MKRKDLITYIKELRTKFFNYTEICLLLRIDGYAYNEQQARSICRVYQVTYELSNY